MQDTPDSEGQSEYDHLSQLSGKDFDRQYANDMVQDHQQDIANSSRKPAADRIPI